MFDKTLPMADVHDDGPSDHNYTIRTGIQTDQFQSSRAPTFDSTPEIENLSGSPRFISCTPSGEISFKARNGGKGDKDVALQDQVQALQEKLRETERAYRTLLADTSRPDQLETEALPVRSNASGRGRSPHAWSMQNGDVSAGQHLDARASAIPADREDRSSWDLGYFAPRRGEDVFDDLRQRGALRRFSPSPRRLRGRREVSPTRARANSPRWHDEPRAYKKPDTYDGRRSWSEYLVHFELIAERNGWRDDVKALELATSLRGAAQGVLSDLRPQQRRDYDELVTALQSMFEPENQGELFKARLKHRIRGRNESIADLSQDIKRLARRAYPDAPRDVRDHLAKDYFLPALNDLDLEWAVHQGKPRTLEEAQSLALEYEAFQRGRKQRTGSKAGVYMQREVPSRKPGLNTGRKQGGPTPTNGSEDVMSRLLQRIQKLEEASRPPPVADYGPQGPRSRPVVCYYCNREGHVRTRCEQMRQDMQRGATNRGAAPTADGGAPASQEN